MKYIASWSGGKDSTASIILAHEHNEPLLTKISERTKLNIEVVIT